MQQTAHRELPVRLNRSQLSVPGNSTRFIEKAHGSDADIIMLDLEDSVAPDEKPAARKMLAEALRDLNWQDKTVSLRVNALDTGLTHDDLEAVLGKGDASVDLVMIPKVDAPDDLASVSAWLDGAGAGAAGTGLEAQIESAMGLLNIREIAAFGGRLEALHFGPGDFAASISARTTEIGGQNPDYPGDMWHHALATIVVAARAFGLRPVDGPVADFRDREKFQVAANRAAALGFDGKWAIHPDQVQAANRIFSPPEAEVDRARRILNAMADAEKAGRGAAAIDGSMIDYASVRQAERMIRIAELVAGKG